jgi:protein-S-isoprenylcysteine O-methyltransferase Ste14
MWISIFTTPLDQPVTTGLFKVSRHPGHLTPFIIFIGLSICTLSPLYFLLSTVFIAFHSLNSLSEEKRELLKYGKMYQSYMEKTPRWFGIPKK